MDGGDRCGYITAQRICADGTALHLNCSSGYTKLSVYVCVHTQSCLTLCDSWTVAQQAPPSVGFSKQEYYSELPFPTPGDLPDPGIEPTSLASPALAGRFFTTESPTQSYTSDKITHIHTHTHTHTHTLACL